MKRIFALTLLTLALATGCGRAAMHTRFGPPAPPREMLTVRPGPRYVWVPGHYEWLRGRYVWVSGFWAIPPRRGAAWRPGYWAPRGSRYAWTDGYWR